MIVVEATISKQIGQFLKVYVQEVNSGSDWIGLSTDSSVLLYIKVV